MMRGFAILVSLAVTVTVHVCDGQTTKSLINPQPACDVKQVFYKMNFPIPYCRECQQHTCFNTKLTVENERQIKEVFSGFFFTSEHIAEVERARVEDGSSTTRRKRGNEDHDGDIYCPTKMTCHNISRLTNSYGIERELVHLPIIGEYQWVLMGECADAEGPCPGGCVEQTATQFLLVWNLDHPVAPMSFEPFDINAYCSCKNINIG